MKYGFSPTGLAISALIAIIAGCAKQAAPAGGPKDVTPPVIVKSNPLPATKNFNARRITVTFDEYVVLDKLNEKFMVSPPMETKPEITLRGKNLIIDLVDELRDSTTYTLYFQDAIKDINEGNPFDNFQYVFATGNVIDSLSITGSVYLADNLEAAKKTLVMLHRVLADTAPAKLLPDYITITGDNGRFRIDNIKGGTYRLYALIDNNNNKRYDLADEQFAFYDSVLNINSMNNYKPPAKDTSLVSAADTAAGTYQEAEGEYKMYLFTGPKKKYYLTSSSRNMPYQLVYTLSLPPDTMKFDFSFAETDEKRYFIERSRAKDTLAVWLPDSALYSLPEINTLITYPFTDSANTVIIKTDTVRQRFLAPKSTRGKVKRNPYKFSTNISGFGLRPGQRIVFSSATPFGKPDTSLIRLFETEGKSRRKILYQLLADSTDSRKYYLEAVLKEGSKYLLSADSAAFGNIYGEVSDSTGISFNVRNSREFGHLELVITNAACPLIVQLLDSKEKLVAERYLEKDGTARFPLLEKGFYRARAVYDLNGDRKWTTGDYDLSRQPEPVSYYPSEIEMRVDFEITNEWDLGVRNYKDNSLRSKEKPGL